MNFLLRDLMIAVIVLLVMYVGVVDEAKATLFGPLSDLLGVKDETCGESSFYRCRGKEIGTELGKITLCPNEAFPIGKCVAEKADTNKCLLSCGAGYGGSWEEDPENREERCAAEEKWAVRTDKCHLIGSESEDELGYCYVVPRNQWTSFTQSECIYCGTENVKCKDLNGDPKQCKNAECTQLFGDVCVYLTSGECVSLKNAECSKLDTRLPSGEIGCVAQNCFLAYDTGVSSFVCVDCSGATRCESLVGDKEQCLSGCNNKFECEWIPSAPSTPSRCVSKQTE